MGTSSIPSDAFTFQLVSLPNPWHPAESTIDSPPVLNQDLHLIHVGTGRLEFRLGDGRRIIAEPGCVAAIPPYQVYTCHKQAGMPLEMVNIHFQIGPEEGAAFRNDWEFPPSFRPPDFALRLRQLRRAVSRWRDPSVGFIQRWRCTLQVHELVVSYGMRFARPARRAVGDAIMREARVQIAAAAAEGEFQSSFFSRQAGLSIPQFNRRFRHAFGLSPKDYWQHARLRIAKARLREPGASIKEVADGMAFSDAFYFSRWFRKMLGQTPSAFRSGPDGGLL